jgi:putative transport protein
MEWFADLFTPASVAGSVLVLALVAASGLTLGSVSVRNIRLGIAGVLFTGLLFGHFKLTLDPHVMEFAREFGLILFVYTIGVQVGPGFFSSLKKEGLPLNLMAAAVVLLGAGVTVGIIFLAGVETPVAVGLFSGATTNTPSLGAAQAALADTPGYTPDIGKLPGLGYAVAYPFGIMGIILTMIGVRYLFRIDLAREESELYRSLCRNERPAVDRINLKIENPNLEGVCLAEVPILNQSGVVFSRILHEGDLSVVCPDTCVHTGDIVLAVGPKDKLHALQLLFGSESDVDLHALPGKITSRRLLVTRKKVLGKTVAQLNFDIKYGVQITRVNRAGIDLSPGPGVKLQLGDTVIAVGEEHNLGEAASILGNSTKQLNHPEVIPVFVGIALGVLLGSFPVFVPGMPAPVRLGLAGGPLLAAITLSRIGRIGPLVWYMPSSANFMVRELGIILFLACVGLKSGDQFVATLLHGDGLRWMALAALITLLPLVIVALAGRVFFKMNYLNLCGLLAGSMTDPPALAFAGSVTGSEAPTVAYATVYPLTMILRILAAQVLVLLLMG